MRRRTGLILVPLVLAGCMLCPSPAVAWPYGMDPVPDAVFYRGAWDRYGSDPVPDTATSDLGFHTIYGLDAIPQGVVPTVNDLRDVLPHQTLEVLTRAIEGGAPDHELHKLGSPSNRVVEPQSTPRRRRFRN
jgi:hypothetical protein